MTSSASSADGSPPTSGAMKRKLSGHVLAPILIPAPTREPSPKRPQHPPRDRKHPELLAMAASAVLVVLVGLELVTADDAAEDVREWSFWVTTLVFPSRQITWLKILCLILGFVLTTSYFLSTHAQLASAEKMMIHSAAVLVSPLKRRAQHADSPSQSGPATPSGTTTASWLASQCQSLLRTDHFGDIHTKAQNELPHLKIRDECKPANIPVPLSASSEFDFVNGKQPIAFDSEYFRGHCLFMVKAPSDSKHSNWAHLFGTKKRRLWVQIQGRFKKPPPPRSILYLAAELPTPDGFQVAFLTRQLVTLLVTLVKTFVPTAHVAFGEKTLHENDSELPHAAFPLFQAVDEFVVTSPKEEGENCPTLGLECFGEVAEAKKIRKGTPVGMEPGFRTDALYTFQFHTMYADLAEWKIVNLPGLPDMDLKRFSGTPSIRLSAYFISTPSQDPSALSSLVHRAKDRRYVFCFSVHHNGSCTKDAPQQLVIGNRDSILISSNAPTPTPSPRKADEAIRQPTSISPQRWRSVSCDQPDVVVRQQARESDGDHKSPTRQSPQNSALHSSIPRPQPRIKASSSVRSMTSMERAEDLSNWRFSLPLWFERVDPAAGTRKVAYLFVVEEQRKNISSPNKRDNRSETMQDPRSRRCVVRTALTVKNTLLLLDADEMEYHGREFRKLVVESREFLYDTICRETRRVAEVLQEIASIPPEEATDIEKDKKAMLFNCLMSEAHLPCIRSYQDIGVQLTKAKRNQMDIIFEKGIYRMLDPHFMRQEWLILTTSEVLFFRSFTLKPSKTVSLSHVLSIRAVDNVPFMEDMKRAADRSPRKNGSSPRLLVREAALRATNRWFCVEIHLVDEVVTLFVDSAGDRAQCVSSMNQLIKLKSSSLEWARLPALRSVEAATKLLCCNQRRQLPIRSETDDSPSTYHSDDEQKLRRMTPPQLLEEIVERGLRVYKCARHEIRSADLTAFLDGVEFLNDFIYSSNADAEAWLPSEDHKLAFLLNLFHALYIHAWLLFGDITTHAQWKKFKSIPFYAIGQNKRQLRLTLADIEYGILQSYMGPDDEYKPSMKSVPSFLVPASRDFRVSLVLQTNSSRRGVDDSLIRVYHSSSLQNELNEACAAFLARELHIDAAARVIHLPKLCEWNADDYDSPSQAVSAGPRTFFCLQKLIPLMTPEQHGRVQHLLLGAGKECQIKYQQRFWTQETVTNSIVSLLKSEPSNRDARKAADDSAIATESKLSATGATGGIPRSKSALQFLQSFFE